MADFDPLTVPAVMPVTVARINEGGFPKQALLDYEQALQAWMKSNVADTNTRLTNVDAKANSATASGQIYFEAKATPAGSTAAYGLYLKAGSSFAGFEAIALSGGGSAIGLTANQIKFTDSGTAQDVFYYSGGKFQFKGNVAIDGSLTINGTIVTAGIAANAVSQTAFASSSETSTNVVVDVRSGAGVAVTASFNGASGTYYALSTTVGAVTVARDGVTIGTVGSNYEASGSGTSAGIAFLQTTVLCGDYPSAGSHTYTVTTTNGAGVGGVAILVQELAR